MYMWGRNVRVGGIPPAYISSPHIHFTEDGVRAAGGTRRGRKYRSQGQGGWLRRTPLREGLLKASPLCRPPHHRGPTHSWQRLKTCGHVLRRFFTVD